MAAAGRLIYIMLSYLYPRNANDIASSSAGTVVTWLSQGQLPTVPFHKLVGEPLKQWAGARSYVYVCPGTLFKCSRHMLYSCLHLAAQIPAYLADYALHWEHVISIPAY